MLIDTCVLVIDTRLADMYPRAGYKLHNAPEYKSNLLSSSDKARIDDVRGKAAANLPREGSPVATALGSKNMIGELPVEHRFQRQLMVG